MSGHIDVEDALEKLENSNVLYLRFLKGFIRRYSKVDLEIAALLNAKEYKEANRLVHSIKGLSGNLGAKALREYADIFEEKLEKNDYNIDEIFSLFKEELYLVKDEINKIIEEIILTSDEVAMDEEEG